jgi:UDP-3-O-[3-hydroxymyristoyl] glucosamine N-acyltransferase
VIGDNVILHSGVVLGADAFYFQRRPEGWKKMESCGRVIIEDNVEIGALSSIDKGVSGDTIIGFGTKMDNHVQVGHDTVIGKHCLIGSHTAIAGVTKIEDEVMIWANCLINKDLVIGKKAVLMAMTGTERSLEGGKVYYGIPADEVRRKWRETASLRKLPEFMREVAKKIDLNY